MIATIHPFAARMAPELALQALELVPEDGVVVDPMMGSGTVIRQASDLGLTAIGFDVDPLAVLMSRVWTTPVDDSVVARVYDEASRVVHLLLVWCRAGRSPTWLGSHATGNGNGRNRGRAGRA